MNTTARIPEGLTDPDAIDAWLEDQDARNHQQAAARVAEDDAVMAAVARHRPNPDAVRDTDMVAAIRARIAHDQLPVWRRLFTPKPAGYLNRHPTGQMHS